ncbi:hypothetical protein ACFO0N_08415 [Halobium salinum]|uniref:Uncharacterized protein n=1 Tax=Halobium salinum TaxID=1364940 RepID=A0ABD5PB94_9EURY|nr:hypothetical protein [Halobium salinum]
MATGTQSNSKANTESTASQTPEVTACETCPGKVVFIESGNNDGWLSSDTVLDVTQ